MPQVPDEPAQPATEAELLAYEHDHEHSHEVDHERELAAHSAMKVRLSRLELLIGLGRAEAGTVAHHLPAWLRRTEGEPRLAVAIAVLALIGLQLEVPDELAFPPTYLLPVIEILLFLALTLANPKRITRESRLLRTTGLLLVGLASLAVAWSVVLLIGKLLHGEGPSTAGKLLINGGTIWLTNVIVFALWYWEFDRGGPAARAAARKPHPDFLFSQMTSPELVDRDWEPGFVDYLYLSFTNATAFSPTDTLPLSRWAKLFMMFQSAISLVTVALVVSRAVNIFT